MSEALISAKERTEVDEGSERESDEERGEQIDKILKKFRNKLILEGKSQSTLRNYTYTLKKFLQNLETLEVYEIELKDIEEFLLEIEGKRSMARHAFALKSFFKLMDRREISEKIPVPRYQQKLPHWLKKNEFEKLKAAAETRRELLIIQLGYDAALRVSELADLKCENVDLSEGYVTITGKGGYQDTIPISKETINLLKKSMDSKKEYVLYGSKGKMHPDTINKIFSKIAERAELKDISFHCLRHSRATHLLLEGVDLAFVNKLLRHRRLDTTSIYLHLLPIDLKKAIESQSVTKKDETDNKKETRGKEVSE